MKNFLIFLVGAATGAIAVSLIKAPILSRNSKIVIDTVTVESPKPLREAIVGEIVVVGRRADRKTSTETINPNQITDSNQITLPDSDSIAVTVPRVIRSYQGANWTARVSGVDPRLEQLSFENAVSSPKPRRWSLSVTAGAALTPCGLQPMIGLGISYSIINF